VNSDGVIKKLLDRGLIKEVGRKQTVGRPILYGTTPRFLEHLGLDDLSDLPDIDSLAMEQVRELEAQRDLFKDGEVVAAAVDEKSDKCQVKSGK
jgi:chromosome segregation and condensation protein ScpB